MTAEEVKQSKVLHVALKNDFFLFTRYFFHAQYRRKYAQWEHLQLIADALKKVVEGDITRLIINVAPRLGKTELAVKNFIAYGLALNPAAKFIHLSYSDMLALDNSEAAKDLVQSSEYQSLFPSVKIKKGSESKKRWYTESGGGVYATSAGGQITGFGAGITDDEESEIGELISGMVGSGKDHWLGKKAKFGGAIIIDDPNKPDDADSETLRRRVNERYDSTISNRTNSRNTPIIIIQQRTHEDDLTGYLLRKQKRIEEGGIWHALSLPSIKEDGTALCPAKHTIEELRALQAHNDIVFQRQHMQNPKPRAGLLFPVDDLHYFNLEKEKGLDDPDYCLVCADPANEGGDDFAGGAFKLIGDKIYLVDVLYNTDGTDHNEPALIKLSLKNKASAVRVEAVMGWSDTAWRIRDGLEARGYQNDFGLIRPRTAKHTRILSRSAFVRNNFYFREDWQEYPQYAKFMRCLTSYLRIQEPGRENKHDDAPDLCEMAASFFEKSFPHLWPVNVAD